MKKLISVVLALALVLSLSAVAFAYEAPAGVNSLAIVGQDIPGVGNWNPADAAGDFELVADNVYEKVIEVTAATTMTVKFAGNDAWDDSCNLGGSYNGDPITIGEEKNLTNGSGAQNMSLTVDEACTLKFTVDMTAGVDAATVLVEKVVAEEEGGDSSEQVITSGSVTAVDYNDAYWGKTVITNAPASGTVTVKFSPATVEYNITAGYYQTGYINAVAQPDQAMPSFNVTEGDEIAIVICPLDATGSYAAGTISYEVVLSATGSGSETPAGPGSNENDPIVFTDASYLATVPANTTLWFAFDDYNDYWNSGIYAQQFNIMGNTGYTVTYSYGSVVANDEMGVVNGEAFCNMQGKYLFSVANNTDSEQNYIIAFSDIPSEDEGIDGSVTDYPTTDAEPYVYTFTIDTTGILNIKISDNERYKIYGLDGEGSESLYFTAKSWSAGPDADYELTRIGEYTVMVWCYGGSAVGNIDGNISCEITFTPDEVDVEIPMEEYIVSGTVLDIGENAVTMEENAENTLFEFTPSETGIYTFTAPEGVLIGNWNTSTFPYDTNPDGKTNVVEWECTGVGQSIMIGVVGSEDTTITVAKKGDADVQEEIVYVDYENTHIPGEFEIEMNEGDKLVNVDITKPQTVVMGEDGFYHLGTADGPVLYVDLISDGFDMSGAWSGYGALTMRGEYVDAEGVSHYYDFLGAMYDYNLALNEDGMYPLTEDLAIYIQAFGGYQGWYMPGLSSFEAIKAGDFNEDSAWLVACYYVETAEEENPGEENPSSGDYSVAGLVVAMMAATAGAVVISKKKEF